MDYCEEDEDEDEVEDGFGAVSDTTIIHLIEDTLNLMEASRREQEEKENHKNNRKEVGVSFKIGDRVEGNYCLEGAFIQAILTILMSFCNLILYTRVRCRFVLPRGCRLCIRRRERSGDSVR